MAGARARHGGSGPLHGGGAGGAGAVPAAPLAARMAGAAGLGRQAPAAAAQRLHVPGAAARPLRVRLARRTYNLRNLSTSYVRAFHTSGIEHLSTWTFVQKRY